MREKIQQYFDRRAVKKQVGSFDASGLIEAVRQGAREAVDILLEAGVDVNTQDEAGHCLLSIAIFHEQNMLFQRLLNASPNLNLQDQKGLSPLCHAIIHQDKLSFRALIAAGADIKQADDMGKSPLIYAAMRNQTSMLRDLLDAGANVDRQDYAGQSALMKAAAENHFATVKILLDSGASMGLQDFYGNTVRDLPDIDPQILDMLDRAYEEEKTSNSESLGKQLGSFLSGGLEGISLLMEQKGISGGVASQGLEWIKNLNAEDQIQHWFQKIEQQKNLADLNWLLNLMVEIKEIRQLILKEIRKGDWKENAANRTWQQQISWLLQTYRQYLEQGKQTDSESWDE